MTSVSQKKILDQLNSGEISFTEASQVLGISKKEIEKLLDNHEWLPSIERITELCGEEKETISNIKRINSRNVLKKSPKSKKILAGFGRSFQKEIQVSFSNVFADLLISPIPATLMINDAHKTFESHYMGYQREEEYCVWN